MGGGGVRGNFWKRMENENKKKTKKKKEKNKRYKRKKAFLLRWNFKIVEGRPAACKESCAVAP